MRPTFGLLETELIDFTTSLVQSHPAAKALFLGGSFATDRFDAYSDLDAKVVVAKGTLRAFFGAFDAMLRGRFSVTEDFYSEAHGSLQANFEIRSETTERILDLFIFDGQIAPQNKDLHGDLQVLVDKDDALRTFVPTAAQVIAKAKAHHRMLVSLARMGKDHTLKEIRRNRASDALYYYQRNLGRLIEAARLVHCPRRLGMGARYVSLDLPPAVCQTIEALLFPTSLDDLESRDREVTERTYEFLRMYASRAASDDPDPLPNERTNNTK